MHRKLDPDFPTNLSTYDDHVILAELLHKTELFEADLSGLNTNSIHLQPILPIR